MTVSISSKVDLLMAAKSETNGCHPVPASLPRPSRPYLSRTGRVEQVAKRRFQARKLEFELLVLKSHRDDIPPVEHKLRIGTHQQRCADTDHPCERGQSDWHSNDTHTGGAPACRRVSRGTTHATFGFHQPAVFPRCGPKAIAAIGGVCWQWPPGRASVTPPFRGSILPG